MNNISDLYYSYLDTPIGQIEVCANNSNIVSIYFSDLKQDFYRGNPVTTEAVTQLKAYFKRQLTGFELPLSAKGTDFQRQVWQALATIPYGATCSYADIANTLQNPKAVRAVGAANGKNPLSIVIPCHRVIGKNGTLTGYAGGLARKSWLLDFEQRS